jgi:uncharacterized protein HemX
VSFASWAFGIRAKRADRVCGRKRGACLEIFSRASVRRSNRRRCSPCGLGDSQGFDLRAVPFEVTKEKSAMKRTAVLTLLLALGVAWSASAKAQGMSVPEYERESQAAAKKQQKKYKKAAKKRRKMLMKSAQRQRKALKKYEKEQRK